MHADRPSTEPASGWQRRARSTDGFTMIEALVATVILTVALLGSFVLLDVTANLEAPIAG
jgi:prepilin-type N-terminal cleavage/methylation domain-containing protein